MSESVSGEPRTPVLERAWVPYAVLVLVGLLSFARTFGYALSNHDDTALITNSQPFLLDAANFFRVYWSDPFTQIAPTAGGIYYRPVLWQSFILDAQLGGADPAYYHASNVVYHLIASGLVFRLLLDFGHPTARALFFSLAFLLHPSLLQATAWIPGRNDSLLAIFVVATILGLRSHLARGGALALASTILFWNLTLYTKEGGLFLCGLVPVLLAADWMKTRTLPRRVIPLGILWAASTFLWLVLRRTALGGFPLFLSQIPGNLEMFVVYIGKTLLPVQLSVVPSTEDSSLLPGLAVVIFLAGSIALARRGRPEVFALGLLWFLGGLAPALLAPSITRGLEHRLYMPMIGMLLVLAEIVRAVRWPVPRRIVAVGAILLLVLFGALTSLRLPDYANPRAYWQSAYQDAPNSLEVQAGLCRVEIIEERWNEASRPCQQATSSRPRDSVLHFLLGWVYLEQGRFEDAEESLRESTRLNRDSPDAWLKLAAALEGQGKSREARSARAFATPRSANP